MKLNHFFIVFVFILLSICIPANAFDETIIIEKVSMHIYGEATYLNGVPIPEGTIIIAKDQFGSQLGNYIIRENGRIGREYGGISDNFEIGVWRNQTDKTNRTMPIMVSFYIDNIVTRDMLSFKQNENIKFNIVLRSLPPTPVITTIQTPIPTEVPISTDIITTQPIIETITPIITPEPGFLSDWDENDYLYYGLISTIIMIVIILIVGIVISYAMDKTSRDDVLGQDGKWEEK